MIVLNSRVLNAVLVPPSGITTKLNNLYILRIETVFIGLLTPTPLNLITSKIINVLVIVLISIVVNGDGDKGLVATVISLVNVLPSITAKLVPFYAAPYMNNVATVLVVVVVPAPKKTRLIVAVPLKLETTNRELLPNLN